MIEEIVFNYLKNKLNVPVTFENINEVEYVLIGKSGSSRFDFTNTATFFIQSYSSSKYKACHVWFNWVGWDHIITSQ